MGTRADPRETIWEQGPSAFAFLVEEWGFTGPERTDQGIADHRPKLHVTVEHWAWRHEAGFATTVQGVDRRTGTEHTASLGCLYVACGLGPLQHVPETAGGSHTISKPSPSMPARSNGSCRTWTGLRGPSSCVAASVVCCLTTADRYRRTR
jgi:hypothetical protein